MLKLQFQFSMLSCKAPGRIGIEWTERRAQDEQQEHRIAKRAENGERSSDRWVEWVHAVYRNFDRSNLRGILAIWSFKLAPSPRGLSTMCSYKDSKKFSNGRWSTSTRCSSWLFPLPLLSSHYSALGFPIRSI